MTFYESEGVKRLAVSGCGTQIPSTNRKANRGHWCILVFFLCGPICLSFVEESVVPQSTLVLPSPLKIINKNKVL